MKIAIQGNPFRGKEIIQLLESLGGKKLYYSNADGKYLVFFIDDNGYISCLHYKNSILKECYKIYTLEEFEKEFPFKIGDKVIFKDTCFNPIIYTITGLEFYRDEFCYLLDDLSSHYSAKKLKLYQPMKEKRNITLTLEKAKEWYNKGGELKEIALQAFTKKELSPLPKSWEEYCKMYPTIQTKYVFASNAPQKYIALWKLEQLRDCYRQGWKPDCTSDSLVDSIYRMNNRIGIIKLYSNHFLSFQSEEIVEEFKKNFLPLIKEAGDLIN